MCILFSALDKKDVYMLTSTLDYKMFSLAFKNKRNDLMNGTIPISFHSTEVFLYSMLYPFNVQDMAPYAFDANARIKHFGDQIGVTDRYTGYRSNLTRGSREPVKMDTYWMDKKSLTGFMNPVSRSHTCKQKMG